jgi:hypothetical protein
MDVGKPEVSPIEAVLFLMAGDAHANLKSSHPLQYSLQSISKEMRGYAK